MHATTKSILNDNKGREPERLQRKMVALKSDLFAFFRGTAPLFYRTLPKALCLHGAPTALVCGDLHLENFGSYKGDNRLVYFDMNDFDEACVAPLTYELVRFLASVNVGAAYLKIGEKQANALVDTFVKTYAAALATTKPRWMERATATGPAKVLLQGLKSRHRVDLIARRTVQKKGKTKLVIDNVRALKMSDQDRHAAESILVAYAKIQAEPSFFTPIDIARRIAGNGSLGLERYVALVQGTGGVDGQYLLDIKRANPSALVPVLKNAQPTWPSEAERVVRIQHITQAISPALLGAVSVKKHSYIIKEMQPTADRINLQALNGKRGALTDVIKTMAHVTAWAHLRGTSRAGTDHVDALAQYAADTAWRDDLIQLSHHMAKETLRQWAEFKEDKNK